MKKSKGVTLAISPLLGAMMLCAGGEQPSARDVYQSKEECSKDWTDDLCEQMNEQDERDYASGNGGGTGTHYFWGPRYYSGSRTVSYQGREISPTSKSSSLPSYSITSRSSSSSRGGRSSPSSVTTGGFGSRSSSPSSSS